MVSHVTTISCVTNDRFGGNRPADLGRVPPPAVLASGPWPEFQQEAIPVDRSVCDAIKRRFSEF
jgi:hypothetical protein